MPRITNIYIHSACIGNPGPGGYGIVNDTGRRIRKFSGGRSLTTNNRMELLERHMLTSLLLLASTAGLAAPSATEDPPIHIWYNSDGDFAYLDRAKVYARTADNGYLVALRADRVRLGSC